MTEARGQRLNEFIAWHAHDIRKTVKANLRQLTSAISHHTSYLGGIPKNPGVLSLAQHLGEVGLIDLHAVATQHMGHQRRTLFLAHRGQLGTVANEQQTAVLIVIDKTDQVIEQGRIGIGYHRGLVNDEERVLGGIESKTEGREVGSRLLTVDTPVDGISRRTGIVGEDLGSTAGWRHQHQFLFHGKHTTHNGRGQCGLTRTGRTTKHHHHLLVAVGHKRGKRLQGRMLLRGRQMSKMRLYLVNQLVLNHSKCKGRKNI